MLTVVRRFVRQLTYSLNRATNQRALVAELDAHIALHVRDNMARGMSAADARRHALLALGGLAQTMDECSDAGGLRWLDRLLS